MKILVITCLLALCFGFSTQAKIYFVSPAGNDSNPGTKAQPFQTIRIAQRHAEPGDTIYLRGGTYLMNESQITSFSKIQAYVTLLDKSGTEGQRIHYWAYPGESPVFDFSQVKPANYRVHAFEVTGSWIHLKGIQVVGIQVTITDVNTQSICFSNAGGSNNIYELLSMHDGQGIGFYLTSGSNNLILNCDAYRNNDYTSKGGGGRNGGNVDGFGNHPDKGSVGNVFRGCRAWFNSDDGYDCISAMEATVFDNCWAFYNGYTSDFTSRADGNGFKAGGYGARPFNKLPSPIPRNIITRCLAVKNKSNGFYSNHHLNGSDWFNNSAYANGTNFNMLNRKAFTEAEYLIDGPGYEHVLKNNISLAPRHAHLTQIDVSRCTMSNNAFEGASAATPEDFISLDLNELIKPRNPDGTLPSIDFMCLKRKSKLINAGVDVGLPFKGKSPDLGYRER